jgi:ATP-dependent DNA helicase RecQ
LRKKLADQENIAPYVVFGDSTLKLMAQIQPQTLKALGTLSGITEYKLNKYGQYFVQEILAFSHEQIIPSPLPSRTHMKTLQLYQQGLTIPEIAKKRGLATSTITEHISELIELNQPIDINSLVESKIQQEIIKIINQVGDKSLKIIRESLKKDVYTYEQIKLVRAWYRRQNKFL